MTGPHGIVVWTVAVTDVPEPLWPRLAALLDDGERARHARYVFPRDRRQHVAAHALKRLLLSALAGLPPQAWTFETAPGGKPRVSRRAGPCFNLSHCDGLVACAASRDVELGVDVEPLARRAPLDLAPRYFAPEEERWLRSLPAAEQPRGFLRLWTLKEAFIKATGRGLAQHLHDFAFSFEPLQVTFRDDALGDSRAWRFEQHQLDGEHLLALAWRANAPETPPTIRQVRFEALLAEAAISTAASRPQPTQC